MSTHIHDELPLLLSGEASRDTVYAAVTHLRECEDCRDELITALLAHAALSSAARITPSSAPARVPDQPPPKPPAESVPDLPDLSSMFAQIRHEVDTDASSATTRARRWRASWVAAAAVAGIAVGGGAVVAAEHLGNGPSSQAVALAAYDQGTRPASAKIVGGDEMKLDATALPSPPQGKRYEVWLTDAARQHMQPLGWVGSNGRSTLTVPADLMNRFSAIEVSVQDVNAPYQYSGVSVLRGSYA
jgi:hypothetical protein